MYVCIRRCFFRGKIWDPGETMTPQSGETIPRHFLRSDLVTVSQAGRVRKVTLKEEEAKEAVKNEKKRKLQATVRKALDKTKRPTAPSPVIPGAPEPHSVFLGTPVVTRGEVLTNEPDETEVLAEEIKAE